MFHRCVPLRHGWHLDHVAGGPLWVALVIESIYVIGCVHVWGRTLGKLIVGTLVVTTDDGGRPNWRASVLRWAPAGWAWGLAPTDSIVVDVLRAVAVIIICFPVLRDPNGRGSARPTRRHDRPTSSPMIPTSPSPGPGPAFSSVHHDTPLLRHRLGDWTTTRVSKGTAAQKPDARCRRRSRMVGAGTFGRGIRTPEAGTAIEISGLTSERRVTRSSSLSQGLAQQPVTPLPYHQFLMTSDPTFIAIERARAGAWKQATTTLPAGAKVPAPYVGKDGSADGPSVRLLSALGVRRAARSCRRFVSTPLPCSPSSASLGTPASAAGRATTCCRRRCSASTRWDRWSPTRTGLFVPSVRSWARRRWIRSSRAAG